MGRVDGRVAFITGGARGQGRAHALKLASEGSDIAIVDACAPMETIPYTLASREDLNQTKKMVEDCGRRCIAEVADVRDQESLDAVVIKTLEAFGHIDIACANAGVHSFAPFWKLTDEQWDQIIGINLTGAWHTVKAVAPTMIVQKSGSIIITSSVMGHETGPDLAHYAASKHGVIGLMKSVALELAPYNVRCNAVLPSVVHTAMGENPATREWIFGRPNATTKDYIEATRHWHALKGRASLSPSAIADAVFWLASDESRHVTGIELPVDAGHLILPGYNHAPIVDPEEPTGPYY